MPYGTIVGRNTDQQELRESWRTPPEIFAALDAVFRFTVDACASPDNALLPRYWTRDDDAASQPWQGERVFCNPPFRGIGRLLAKATTAAVAVFLLPVTSMATRYFAATPPRYLLVPPRRLRFVPPEGLVTRAVSPCLATVAAIYDDVTADHLDGLAALDWIPFLAVPRSAREWNSTRPTTTRAASSTP